MFKKLSTAAVLLSTIAISANANATEVSLESYMNAMLAQAVSTTQQELANSVQKAVLTANNMISFEESEVYATKITITDLESDEAIKEKAE